MKNIMESFAVLLVGLLSALIVYLIVQYNMIEDDNFIEEIAYAAPAKKKETTKSYLDDMEKYTDVDVKVDPTKDDATNSVNVKSELAKDNLKDTVDDESKSTYTKNLESYKEKDTKPQTIDEVGQAVDTVVSDTKEEKIKPGDAPELKSETIDDEIGMAIDNALNDL